MAITNTSVRETAIRVNTDRIVSAVFTRIGSLTWIDAVFDKEAIDYLSEMIKTSSKNPVNLNDELAGNITRSEKLVDEGNWFYVNVLKEHVEAMYYSDWDNYYEAHISRFHGPPKFELDELWVNYQKQYEFNPVHRHNASYSFVIFMNIPYHWEEQQKRFRSNSTFAGSLQFLWSETDSTNVETFVHYLCQGDRGRMLFFPSHLNHQVYPFYGTEEERITISGNISRVGSGDIIDFGKKKKD